MIREAVSTDIAWLNAMGERFHALTDYPATYDRDTVNMTLEFMMRGENAFILVDSKEAGAIGVSMFPLHFNVYQRVAALTFHWSDKAGTGLKLLKSAEEKARYFGVSLIHAHVLSTAPKVGKLYERYGYKETETIMAKVL